MKESEIEKQVCDYATFKGIIVRKFTSPGHRGVPDRIFFAPRGRVFLIEFKKPGGSIRPDQIREVDLLRTNNIDVRIIDNVIDGRAVVEFYAQ